MTDEELVKRLRADEGDWLTDLAADRIEALTAEKDEHWKSFVHWRKEADDLTEQLEQLVAINEAARADAKEAEAYAEELEKQHDKVWDEAVWAVAQVVDQEMARIGFIAGPDGFGRRAEMRNVIVEELKSAQSMRATLAEIENSEAVTLGEKI